MTCIFSFSYRTKLSPGVKTPTDLFWQIFLNCICPEPDKVGWAQGEPKLMRGGAEGDQLGTAHNFGELTALLTRLSLMRDKCEHEKNLKKKEVKKTQPGEREPRERAMGDYC